ncbi:DUF4179 domain-containing protein [Bacillus pinisoli]|uniref:DUF4179 domain-containing protein n=1 Tax=Bacillus pinisoli TaxID=2901866 RepID=UPI001FF6A8B0|nr:DUF4179 domain-containing protein [Bacillus pinisoli]
MKKVEQQLHEAKNKFNDIEAPPELENRLKQALETRIQEPSGRKVSSVWLSLTAAILLIIFAGYHYNALAFYGKKILGFDQLIDGTLKELNEEGRGQIIEESFSLHDGTVLTINGLMMDVNRMIMYYTLTNPNGIEKAYSDYFQPDRLTGFLTNAHYEGGQGIRNDDGTELKGTMEFEAPSPFSKSLTLYYWEYLQHGQMQEQKISIPYDPNKAMKEEVVQTIRKTVKVDRGEIRFDSIVASPTVTVISGKLDVEGFDRISLGLQGIELRANNEPVQQLGAGISSSIFGGREFEIDFDALPDNLDKLELYIKEFIGYEKINQSISLKKVKGTPINIGGEELVIKEVLVKEGIVEVKIATNNQVLLDDVFIQTATGKVELTTTTGHQEKSDITGKLAYERILLFDTAEDPEELLIGGIYYSKRYEEIITIPLN